MANPQPDEFTRISNELLEALCKINLSGQAMQILLVIFRKTYGYNKKQDRISLTQFSNLTNIKISNCSRSIKYLENMNLITVKREGYISEYSVQKNYEKWQILSKLSTLKIEDDTLNSDTLKIEPDTLKIESETTLKIESNKRKKDILQKKEKTEQNITPIIQNIWVRSFSRTPKILEQETTANLIKKFGADKTLQIFQDAVRKNFHSVFSLEKTLDDNGNIKPKGNNNETSKSSVKSRTDYRHDPIKAAERLRELEEMDSR